MRVAAWVAVLASVGVLEGRAARPMITDDARIVDAGACQLETWTRRNPDSREYWAVPACNFSGNLEASFGGARDNAGGFTESVVQAKTVVKPLEQDGWGAAFTLGTVRHPRLEGANDWAGDPYINLPLSVTAMPDTWVAHFNAGASYRRGEKRTVGTWGFGNEVRLGDGFYFIPEIFRSEPGRPFYQLGFRYWVVKDFLQMDATCGSRFGSHDQRWISVGLRILTPPFMQ